jgi:hypothetical protein
MVVCRSVPFPEIKITAGIGFNGTLKSDFGFDIVKARRELDFIVLRDKR